jgi:hypothetical protein
MANLIDQDFDARLRALTDKFAARDWDNWLAALDVYLAWAALDPKSDDYPDNCPQ